MTVEIFLMLLTAFSVVTALSTEAVKKYLDTAEHKYTSNIIVLIVSAIIGGGGTAVYYIIAGCEWNAINIVCILLMVIANWLGSMLGYDKVKQAIQQFKTK